jgi:hypothetical protein
MALTKFILSFLMLLAICLQALGNCWQWTTNGIPAEMGYGPDRQQYFMAFDEQQGRPAILLSASQSNYELELWHYDGRVWNKTWSGIVNAPRGYFAGPGGLYFDPNQNALIMIAFIIYDFEIASNMAFKFVEGQGWIYIDETDDTCISRNVLPIYDSKRGRAVLVLSYCLQGDFFLEFDGFKFHYIEIDRKEYNFEGGVAGFNAETGRVVCLCDNRGHDGYGTYEYDGNTWSLVAFPNGFPSVGAIISGLTFMPNLSGMLLLSAVMSDPQNPWEWEQQMWIYSNLDWMRLPFEGQPSVLSDAPMCLDPLRNRVVLFGGILEDLSYSKLTWELRNTRHCRPLGKP